MSVHQKLLVAAVLVTAILTQAAVSTGWAFCVILAAAAYLWTFALGISVAARWMARWAP